LRLHIPLSFWRITSQLRDLWSGFDTSLAGLPAAQLSHVRWTRKKGRDREIESDLKKMERFLSGRAIFSTHSEYEPVEIIDLRGKTRCRYICTSIESSSIADLRAVL
jgi:hypothetical protein